MGIKHIRETIAATCRYGGNACEAFKDAFIIFERSEADWQGFANIFGILPDGRYFHYEWTYGSCSGCDEWEASCYSDKQINETMINGANYFDNIESVKKYLRLDEEFCKEMNYPCVNVKTNGAISGMMRTLTSSHGDDLTNMALAFDEYCKTEKDRFPRFPKLRNNKPKNKKRKTKYKLD